MPGAFFLVRVCWLLQWKAERAAGQRVAPRCLTHWSHSFAGITSPLKPRPSLHPAPTHPPCCQAWGAWWALTTFAHYLDSLAARRPFRSTGWNLLPWGSSRLRALPFEPLVKVALPLAGILGELWLGHESYR